MQVEEFGKLSKEELRQRANESLLLADSQGLQAAPGNLARAQFYMRELEHRRDSWVSIRDLVLELFVIGLIGWEIWLGYAQEKQQKQNFTDQQKVLGNMLDSSKDAARTMSLLQSTTQKMSDALQQQLNLFYDVSLLVIYDADKKVMTFQNNGRTNMSLWGIGSVFLNWNPTIIAKDGRVLVPFGGYTMPLSELYTVIAARYPVVGSTTFVSFEVYVKNERNEEFVVHNKIGVSWDKDKLVLTTQLVSISPEHWSRTFHPIVP
jgi:hypothetical protein